MHDASAVLTEEKSATKTLQFSFQQNGQIARTFASFKPLKISRKTATYDGCNTVQICTLHKFMRNFSYKCVFKKKKKPLCLVLRKLFIVNKLFYAGSIPSDTNSSWENRKKKEQQNFKTSPKSWQICYLRSRWRHLTGVTVNFSSKQYPQRGAIPLREAAGNRATLSFFCFLTRVSGPICYATCF